MDECSYLLVGIPLPLARPRFAKGRVYDCQKGEKEKLRWELLSQHGSREKFSGPLYLEVVFFFRPSSGYSEKKRKDLLMHPHVFKPDLSNLLKFLEDVCTPILFTDDCIISSICAKKIYGETARTEFVIKKLV